jgi:hypothetical protein
MAWSHLKNHGVRIGHIYMKAVWYIVDSSIFKLWFSGVGRVHNRENHIHLFILKKKIFSRTSKPISIKLGTNLPWVKGLLNCTNKRPVPLQRGDIHKNAKNLTRSWNFFLENHLARIAHIYMKAFWHCADLSLYKLWSPTGSGWGIQGGKLFLHLYIKKNLLKWNIWPN